MKTEIRDIVRAGLDQRVASLQLVVPSAKRPARGWLRAVRNAVGERQDVLANKMGLKRQSYADLENAEERGVITLASLARAADALGCELVYFLVPRAPAANTFSELAERRDPKLKHLKASEHSMALEGQAVGDLARKKKSSE